MCLKLYRVDFHEGEIIVTSLSYNASINNKNIAEGNTFCIEKIYGE
jgi:hypothetical protein